MLWQGKDIETLTDIELGQAICFYNLVVETVQQDPKAPVSVWGYFSDKVTEMTLLQYKRLVQKKSA